MNALLRDLCGHQAWADAEHWRTIQAHTPAREDTAIRNRLHHIHLVQRLFSWAVGDRATEFTFSKPEDFQTLEDLRVFALESHAHLNQFLSRVTDNRLSETVEFSWFKDPPLRITVTEALTQCAMHSQWHRGQNATRLRELGGVPPNVDLIVWYWKARPEAQW